MEISLKIKQKDNPDLHLIFTNNGNETDIYAHKIILKNISILISDLIEEFNLNEYKFEVSSPKICKEMFEMLYDGEINLYLDFTDNYNLCIELSRFGIDKNIQLYIMCNMKVSSDQLESFAQICNDDDIIASKINKDFNLKNINHNLLLSLKKSNKLLINKSEWNDITLKHYHFNSVYTKSLKVLSQKFKFHSDHLQINKNIKFLFLMTKNQYEFLLSTMNIIKTYHLDIFLYIDPKTKYITIEDVSFKLPLLISDYNDIFYINIYNLEFMVNHHPTEYIMFVDGYMFTCFDFKLSERDNNFKYTSSYNYRSGLLLNNKHIKFLDKLYSYKNIFS